MSQDPSFIKVRQPPPRSLYARALDAWRSLRSNGAARKSVYSIGSQVSVSASQAIQFVLLARALGSHEFGMVASVLAITSILLHFGGLGLSNVSVRHIARGEARAEQSLGNGLAVIVLTAVIGVLAALGIGVFALTEPGIWLLVLCFGISDLLFTKYIDVAAHVFMGLDRQGVALFFYNLVMFLRLVCAVALYLGFTPPTALAWAQLHLLAGAASAAVVLCVSVFLVGRPRTDYAVAKKEIGKGIFIAFTMAAHTAQTDADRVVLARVVTSSTAGAYTAAFRLVNLGCMPITAALFSLQARVFQKAHENGLSGAFATLRPFLSVSAAYSVCLGLGIYVAAPVMPWLLGSSFSLSAEILRWLCFLPALVTCQSVAMVALLGVDAERRVSFLQMLAAALSILLNLLLVPEFGWRGAVMTAYASEGFLIAGLVAIMLRIHRAQAQSKPTLQVHTALETP